MTPRWVRPRLVCPGLVRPGLVRAGLVRAGLVRPRLGRPRLDRPRLGRPRLGRPRLRHPRLVRGVGSLAAAAAALLACSVGLAPPAAAHPLGNFSVNTATHVRLTANAVAVEVIVDLAEVPTLQAFPDADRDAVPAAAAAGYRSEQCDLAARRTSVELAGARVALSVGGSRLALRPGAAGLRTARLTCLLRSAPRDVRPGSRVVVRSPGAGDGVGWREITVAGDGVAIKSSDVPAASPSHGLTAYPNDLLSDPLDIRRAAAVVGDRSRAGEAGATDGPGGGPGARGGRAEQGPDRGVGRLAAAYTDLVGTVRLTPAFAALAVVLAVALGALHAFAPGHGKTVMAAYVVGRNGTLRQAAVIGLSVTATHTLGVLVLGTVLSLAAVATPERAYPWLGLASGVLLVGIGGGMLLQRGGTSHHHVHAHPDGHGHAHPDGHGHAHPDGHGHAHPDGHGHGHAHGQGHGHPDEHGHGHGHAHGSGHDHWQNRAHGHGHDHGNAHRPGHDHRLGRAHGRGRHPAPDGGAVPAGRPSLRGLVAVGLAGGLVPSPSALVVLLGGIALHRAWFAVLLVLAYGVGMALALVATGLLLVHARARVERWLSGRGGTAARRAAELGAVLPALTALVVLLAGAGVAGQALSALAG